LAAEHRDLVAQRQQLREQGTVTAGRGEKGAAPNTRIANR
jgi:hypothetical protein